MITYDTRWFILKAPITSDVDQAGSLILTSKVNVLFFGNIILKPDTSASAK